MRNLTLVGVAFAAALFAAPACAVITTFASFSPIGIGTNVRFSNTESDSNASFFTIATSVATQAGTSAVFFSFLNSSLDSISGVQAQWTLAGTITNTVATVNGQFITQSNIAGSFSFISEQVINVDNKSVAAGANLLSGTFTNSTIFGGRNGSTANFSGSTPTSAISYSSDFLDFDTVTSSDFAISLTQIASALNAAPTGGTPTTALRSFRAVADGQFSTDPAPTVDVVPEPATWMQLIAGFALVGLLARRRKARLTA